MGSTVSSITQPSFIFDSSCSDGDENTYHSKFIEGPIIGAGEFGNVRILQPKKKQTYNNSDRINNNINDNNDVDGNEDDSANNDDDDTIYAVKIIKKAYTIRDNVVYPPPPPAIIKRECLILRTLQGRHNNTRLHAVYESPSLLWIVTELCAGGDLLSWSSERHRYNKETVTMMMVSQIAAQLLQAVGHCHKHGIIHRDVKPENVMFCSFRDVDLRLIDYGSGTMDDAKDKSMIHTTYIGTAFYNSPEMFQRCYTSRTDVWSVGVTLYVLVAGFPWEGMQEVFNVLQCAKRTEGDWKGLFQNAVPEGCRCDDLFDVMMRELLEYRHKRRKSAMEMLGCDFVKCCDETRAKSENILP